MPVARPPGSGGVESRPETREDPSGNPSGRAFAVPYANASSRTAGICGAPYGGAPTDSTLPAAWLTQTPTQMTYMVPLVPTDPLTSQPVGLPPVMIGPLVVTSPTMLVPR